MDKLNEGAATELSNVPAAEPARGARLGESDLDTIAAGFMDHNCQEATLSTHVEINASLT